MSDFHVTFISNVSDPIYNSLNKTTDFWTKLTPAIRFDGKYEVALEDCIIKKFYDVIRKDKYYEVAIKPYNWPESVPIDKEKYPRYAIPYRQFRNIDELCKDINLHVGLRRGGGGTLHYSSDLKRVLISDLPENERFWFSEDLRELLGFADNNMMVKTPFEKKKGIYGEYEPGFFSSYNCIFVYTSFIENTRIGNSNVPVLRVLDRKASSDDIHHYNIRQLQYVPVNSNEIELCQITLKNEFGEYLPISKGLAVFTCHFRPVRNAEQ